MRSSPRTSVAAPGVSLGPAHHGDSGVDRHPGRTRCSPFTTTSSPASRPLRTTRRPIDERPEHDRARFDLLVARRRRGRSADRGRCRRRDPRRARPRSVTAPGRRRRTNRPGCQTSVRVAKDRAASNRAGRRIELVVEKLQRALVLERSARRRAPSRMARLPCAHAGGAARAIAVAEERLLVGVERRVDRIDGHDRREQRRFALAAGHEVAARDERAADAAVDRRHDLRELEIRARPHAARRRPRRRAPSPRPRRRPPLALLERHRVVGRQTIRALHFRGGAIARGAVACASSARRRSTWARNGRSSIWNSSCP